MTRVNIFKYKKKHIQRKTWFYCMEQQRSTSLCICRLISIFLVIFFYINFMPIQVYDARTMSKSPFPCGLRRETLRSSYRFTGIVASTILFNSAQWQIWKNRKPVARRHIALTLYDPRTGTAQWSWGQRTILDCHFGTKMIVDSCDSRKEPARSPHDALAGPIKSYGHRTVILR